MEQYYEKPTQVIFIEEDELLDYGPEFAHKCQGIAFRDVVICGCCGSVIPLDEIAYIYEEPNGWYDTNIGRLDFPNDSILKEIQDGIEEAYDWLMEDKPE